MHSRWNLLFSRHFTFPFNVSTRFYSTYRNLIISQNLTAVVTRLRKKKFKTGHNNTLLTNARYDSYEKVEKKTTTNDILMERTPSTSSRQGLNLTNQRICTKCDFKVIGHYWCVTVGYATPTTSHIPTRTKLFMYTK